MLSGRKVKLVQFDVRSSFTWSWRTAQYRHFGKTRIQVVRPSPLKQFRSRRTLSVTDLVSPAWCEVQFDYGLRGKRSRPIKKRPKSFVSSTGKKISINKMKAKKNEVRRDQGSEVHKQLELEVRKVESKAKKNEVIRDQDSEVHKQLELEVREVEPKAKKNEVRNQASEVHKQLEEVRMVEPKDVKISSKETRYALRLVNMLACLKRILVDGYTREMPVFGVVHDEVLFGTVDEIIQVPISAVSPKWASPIPTRARRKSMSRQNVIPSCLESREKVLEPRDRREGADAEGSTSSTSGVNPHTMLYLKDSKTRRHPFVPPHHDTLSGRLQLMLYRRLLSQLVAKSPLYDFKPLWKRLGVKSSSRLPTKFLVQTNLISDNTDLQTTSLDDVVFLWHELVKEANVQGVSKNLELLYRLRPPPGWKKKSKAVSFPEVDNCDTANTPKDVPTLQIAASENSTAGSSKHMEVSTTVTKRSGEEARPSTMRSRKRFRRELREPEGILKIFGRKKFRHDDRVLDAYLTHILKWWRGERKPLGVPLTRRSRCSSCEYSNDCEWRIGIQNSLE